MRPKSLGSLAPQTRRLAAPIRKLQMTMLYILCYMESSRDRYGYGLMGQRVYRIDHLLPAVSRKTKRQQAACFSINTFILYISTMRLNEILYDCWQTRCTINIWAVFSRAYKVYTWGYQRHRAYVCVHVWTWMLWQLGACLRSWSFDISS